MFETLIVLTSVIFTLSVSTVSAEIKESNNAKKPNFVIILADDLGYGDVGFTGSKQIKTPKLDLLAQGGVIFKKGYVSAPVCGPSRAGLITERNQVDFGFDNNIVSRTAQYNAEHFGLPLSEITIADRLKKVRLCNWLNGEVALR